MQLARIRALTATYKTKIKQMVVIWKFVKQKTHKIHVSNPFLNFDEQNTISPIILSNSY
jgi:hypothetical protein